MKDSRLHKVAVITGFYQSPRFLVTLFDYLDRQAFKNFHVYVYNYSFEYIEEIRQKSYSFEYSILKLKENVGFAGGNNFAIQYAKRQADYDFYALINDDTKPDVNWLANLVNVAAADATIGAVTSKMLFYEPYLILQGSIKSEAPEGVRKIKPRFYENTGFDECYYHKLFYLKGFHQPQEDEIYPFRWVDDAFTVAIPLSLKNTSAPYTLKLFIRTAASEKEQRLSLSVGNIAIAEINLDADQVCYALNIPADVVEKSATHIIQNAGSAYDKKYNGFDKGSGEPDKGQYDEMQETEMFCGGACLLSKKALEQTGLFNSRFFSYYEDSDLSLRLTRKGFRIVYAPNAFIYHHHSGSGKEWSPFFTYHVFRNKIIFSAKNFGIHGFLSAFKERTKETWFLFKWAARGRFSDHNLKARLKLNYRILIDAVVGIIKYKPAKF